MFKYKLLVPVAKFLTVKEISLVDEAFITCVGPDAVIFPNNDKLVHVILELVKLPDTFKVDKIASAPDTSNVGVVMFPKTDKVVQIRLPLVVIFPNTDK